MASKTMAEPSLCVTVLQRSLVTEYVSLRKSNDYQCSTNMCIGIDISPDAMFFYYIDIGST